jgi:hypothetical protein
MELTAQKRSFYNRHRSYIPVTKNNGTNYEQKGYTEVALPLITIS